MMNETDSNILVMRQTALADGYSLAALMMQFPTHELTSGLVGGEVAEDAASIVGELDFDDTVISEIKELFSRWDGSDESALFELLRRERTRLFTHPDAPVMMPYEGVFIDGERVRQGKPSTEARLFINPAALDAERCYRKAGMHTMDTSSIPGDGMTTELEFLAYLHQQLASALAEDGEARYEELESIRNEFVRLHVDKWFEAFFSKLRKESPETPFDACGAFGLYLLEAEKTLLQR